MKFKLADRTISSSVRNAIVLFLDNWDDYGNKTTFHANYIDSLGTCHQLGTVKIGMADPEVEGEYNGFTGRTSDYLQAEFEYLPDVFFSLWQSAEAYKLVKDCEKQCHFNILKALNDISYDPSIYERYKNEKVMGNSLFRSVSYSLYLRQFRRIARGEAVLTPYAFSYITQNDNELAEDCELDFTVVPEVLPPTNIHAIIGSNGVGKTTLIKNMIKSICKNDNRNGRFMYADNCEEDEACFENTICVSFNPFDDYSDVEQFSKNFNNISIKKEYEPIGEDAFEDGYGELSLLDDVRKTFMRSLKNCLVDMTKKKDLKDTLEMLETEFNFISSNYDFDFNIEGDLKEVLNSVSKSFNQLSAGHKVVLSIIIRCIDVLVEKSVIFIDEPENHLHPPLLTSLIRGLSKMLIKRNGVAIISTHSPIVLQEIPKSCVWVLSRNGSVLSARRPEIETFGTNIGILTNEIFGFEVKRTGFNRLLQSAVNECNDYESVLEKFNYQLGDEAKSIVRIMLKMKEKI